MTADPMPSSSEPLTKEEREKVIAHLDREEPSTANMQTLWCMLGLRRYEATLASLESGTLRDSRSLEGAVTANREVQAVGVTLGVLQGVSVVTGTHSERGGMVTISRREYDALLATTKAELCADLEVAVTEIERLREKLKGQRSPASADTPTPLLRALHWLNEEVEKGRGAVVFGFDEGGRVGCWLGENGPKLGVGREVLDALLDAAKRKEPIVESQRPSPADTDTRDAERMDWLAELAERAARCSEGDAHGCSILSVASGDEDYEFEFWEAPTLSRPDSDLRAAIDAAISASSSPTPPTTQKKA